MLKGLPGSGKSHWAKNNCGPDVIRVNKDDIRAMMGGEFSKGKEKIVLAVRDSLIREGLSQHKTVIVDDTNFAQVHEDTLRGIAKEFDAYFEVENVNTPVDECIKRDASRANPVGRGAGRGRIVHRRARVDYRAVQRHQGVGRGRQTRLDELPAVDHDV